MLTTVYIVAAYIDLKMLRQLRLVKDVNHWMTTHFGLTEKRRMLYEYSTDFPQ